MTLFHCEQEQLDRNTGKARASTGYMSSTLEIQNIMKIKHSTLSFSHVLFNLHGAKLEQQWYSQTKQNSALMLELNHKCQTLYSQSHKYKPWCSKKDQVCFKHPRVILQWVIIQHGSTLPEPQVAFHSWWRWVCLRLQQHRQSVKGCSHRLTIQKWPQPHSDEPQTFVQPHYDEPHSDHWMWLLIIGSSSSEMSPWFSVFTSWLGLLMELFLSHAFWFVLQQGHTKPFFCGDQMNTPSVELAMKTSAAKRQFRSILTSSPSCWGIMTVLLTLWLSSSTEYLMMAPWGIPSGACIWWKWLHGVSGFNNCSITDLFGNCILLQSHKQNAVSWEPMHTPRKLFSNQKKCHPNNQSENPTSIVNIQSMANTR